MPITAMLDDGTRVKARSWEHDPWRDMVGSKDRPDFYCMFCEGEMHPRSSSKGLQHFAHNRGGPDCVFRFAGGESSTHMHVKDYLTAAIDKAAGWEAFPEHRIEHDGRHRIADVYAKRIDGKPAKPSVFEVQLSDAPDSEILQRDAFYGNAGSVSTWLTMKPVPWFHRAPSLRIKSNPSDRLVIVDGLMLTDEKKAPETLLEKFVAKRLQGRYQFVQNIGIIGRGDWSKPTTEPRPKWEAQPTGGSDVCDRQPPARPKIALPASPTQWTMNLSGGTPAGPGETECGWLGCPAAATRRLAFPNSDWSPGACPDHAAALAERYGLRVTA